MAEGASSAASWPLRVGLATFLLLLVFGLALLFVPDFARELDDRTAATSEQPDEAVSVTTVEKTTEQDARSTTSGRTKKTSSGAGGSRGDRPAENGKRGRGTGANGPDERSATRSKATRRDDRTITETATTTTTEAAAPISDGGDIADELIVPAVAVLSRVTLVALLAALAGGALSLLGRGRRDASVARPSSEVPGASSTASNSSDPPSRPSPARPSNAPSPPAAGRPLVLTPGRAEVARARALEGIPLLTEIFAARGEPRIEETLPDMRARVRLTETLTKDQPLPTSLFAADVALGVASFRTELEQRLRRLARDAELQGSPTVESILRRLHEEGLFEAPAVEGFSELLRLTQQALHASTIDPAVTAWVTERGVPLLVSLDLMLPS